MAARGCHYDARFGQDEYKAYCLFVSPRPPLADGVEVCAGAFQALDPSPLRAYRQCRRIPAECHGSLEPTHPDSVPTWASSRVSPTLGSQPDWDHRSHPRVPLHAVLTRPVPRETSYLTQDLGLRPSVPFIVPLGGPQQLPVAPFLLVA